MWFYVCALYRCLRCCFVGVVGGCFWVAFGFGCFAVYLVIGVCWFWRLLFVCFRLWLGSLVNAWVLLAACCTGLGVWFASGSFVVDWFV